MSDPKIEDVLAELERLDAEATNGPWRQVEHLVVLPIRNEKYPEGECRWLQSLTFEHEATRMPNAALIAAARNALPALLRLARLAVEARKFSPHVDLEHSTRDYTSVREWECRFDSAVGGERRGTPTGKDET